MAGTGRALLAANGDSGSEITLTRTRPAKAGIVFVRLKSSVFLPVFAYNEVCFSISSCWTGKSLFWKRVEQAFRPAVRKRDNTASAAEVSNKDLKSFARNRTDGVSRKGGLRG
jgi:hypothetical protein